MQSMRFGYKELSYLTLIKQKRLLAMQEGVFVTT